LVYGIIYSDLKPHNLVLERYENSSDSEITIYKPCYKLKFIDLGSFTIINDIDEFGIKSHNIYPMAFTNGFNKSKFEG
jgi:serine/threonine protein kinase